MPDFDLTAEQQIMLTWPDLARELTICCRRAVQDTFSLYNAAIAHTDAAPTDVLAVTLSFMANRCGAFLALAGTERREENLQALLDKIRLEAARFDVIHAQIKRDAPSSLTH